MPGSRDRWCQPAEAFAIGRGKTVAQGGNDRKEQGPERNIAVGCRQAGQCVRPDQNGRSGEAKQATGDLGEAEFLILGHGVCDQHRPDRRGGIQDGRETGADLMAMNNYGCSLVWGHPQGPTGLRGVIELIEELAIRGGGRGLFHGCAAGDTAMAVVVEVADA